MTQEPKERRAIGKEGKILILEYLLENTDVDVMRNTLTRISERLDGKMSRTVIHRYLRGMVEQNILVRDEDETLSVKNQMMKIYRYRIVGQHVDNVKKLVADYRASGLNLVL